MLLNGQRLLYVGDPEALSAAMPELGTPANVTQVSGDLTAVDLLDQPGPFDVIVIGDARHADGQTPLIVSALGIAPEAKLVVLPGLSGSAADSREPPHFRADDRRVLVVDDDRSAVRLIARFLETAGYEVLTAANGAQGMRTLIESDIHIVVSDWEMPEMGGIEFCRRIRSGESIGFVYFMVVTARTEKDKLTTAFDAGADDFLTKPVDRAELLSRVRAGSRIVRLEADITRHNREIHKANADMAILNERLQQLAATDGLTGLTNRRRAIEKLSDLWTAAQRYGMALTCLMMDIDHFKGFNDTYGHAAGDAVLRATADCVSAQVRATDVVARIGGEEFLVIVPNTSSDEARILAERIRSAMAAMRVLHDGRQLSTTVSLGIAEKHTGIRSEDDLLRAADCALYAAKNSGRNRVCSAADTMPQGADSETTASCRSVSE